MRRRAAVMLAIAMFCSVVMLGAFPVAQAAPGPTVRGDRQAATELEAVYKRFDEQRSWRSRMSFPGPPPGSMTSEFVAPNRMHIIMNIGGEVTDIFLIGDAMYIKGGRDCTKLPQKVNMPNPREHMQQDASAVVEVARGGAEAVEGTPTQTYNLTVTAQGRTFRQKMYVAGTGLPRRLETFSAEGTVVIDYLEYGAGIVINDPPC